MSERYHVGVWPWSRREDDWAGYWDRSFRAWRSPRKLTPRHDHVVRVSAEPADEAERDTWGMTLKVTVDRPCESVYVHGVELSPGVADPTQERRVPLAMLVAITRDAVLVARGRRRDVSWEGWTYELENGEIVNRQDGDKRKRERYEAPAQLRFREWFGREPRDWHEDHDGADEDWRLLKQEMEARAKLTEGLPVLAARYLLSVETATVDEIKTALGDLWWGEAIASTLRRYPAVFERAGVRYDAGALANQGLWRLTRGVRNQAPAGDPGDYLRQLLRSHGARVRPAADPKAPSAA